MTLRFFCILFLLVLSYSPVFSQSAHQEVKAGKGDGIFTLLRENGLDPATYFNAFVELNRDNIGKDSSLFVGKTYLLPLPSSSAAKTTTEVEKTEAVSDGTSPGAIMEYPLFGDKYASVEIKGSQLEGAVYYLLSGHGGPDPGAIGQYGPYSLGEDEYAYDITLRLARILMEHGATVYVIVQDKNDGIRDGNILELDIDEVCYPDQEIPLNHIKRLRQRTQAINKLYLEHKGKYQRMLSIHVDSRSKTANIDVFFYHHKNSPLGEKLAKTIHSTIANNYNRHQPNRDYFGNVSDRSSLYVVKYSHPPAVFVELGNIRNEKDQRRFVLPDNRQALANWMSQGIIADFSGHQ